MKRNGLSMKRRKPISAAPIKAGRSMTSATSTLASTSGYASTCGRTMRSILQISSGSKRAHKPPSITTSTSQTLMVDAITEDMASNAFSTTDTVCTSRWCQRSIRHKYRHGHYGGNNHACQSFLIQISLFRLRRLRRIGRQCRPWRTRRRQLQHRLSWLRLSLCRRCCYCHWPFRQFRHRHRWPWIRRPSAGPA